MSEKWPFSSLLEPLPDEKSGRKRRRIAHGPCFCARFLLKFCCFSRFCKHAKFSKVNAKFSKVVDFFFSSKPLFCKNQTNRLTINRLANPQKTGLFSSKSFFLENFRNMEAKNGCFVNIFQNKSVQKILANVARLPPHTYYDNEYVFQASFVSFMLAHILMLYLFCVFASESQSFCVVSRFYLFFFVTLPLRGELTWHSEEKTNEFVLFFPRFFVTLHAISYISRDDGNIDCSA